MKNMRSLAVVLALLALVLTACGPGERAVNTGALLESFDFEAPGTFEEGDYGSTELRIAGGRYQIEIYQDEGIIWGQQGQSHSNVVVEVVAMSGNAPSDALYGVMCRAAFSNNGDGYLFAISPDGSFNILKGEGDGYIRLANGSSSAISSGTNTIRAVCIGDYLGMYVNGTFVGAAQDGTYQSGLPALAAGRGVYVAEFDDLTVYSAGFAE